MHQRDDARRRGMELRVGRVEGSRRSSFHSTLNSLRGLLSYEMQTGDSARVAGEPSPWLTLIGTRVFAWWDAHDG
ncbi:hypothetical protein ACQ7HM_00020 [Williamsia sp. MIQD14]|uniref:hypothetical protein n=1 Tax=Williamsia sp. MIQD14 TaxID=3425703 RepID=UPI003DA1BEE1